MMTLQKLQTEVGAWSDQTFKAQTPESKIRHLKREVEELLNEPRSREELADCLILIIDIARLTGTDAQTLLYCAFEKLEICKNRKWNAPDHEGVCSHVKEEA